MPVNLGLIDQGARTLGYLRSSIGLKGRVLVSVGRKNDGRVEKIIAYKAVHLDHFQVTRFYNPVAVNLASDLSIETDKTADDVRSLEQQSKVPDKLIQALFEPS